MPSSRSPAAGAESLRKIASCQLVEWPHDAAIPARHSYVHREASQVAIPSGAGVLHCGRLSWLPSRNLRVHTLLRLRESLFVQLATCRHSFRCLSTMTPFQTSMPPRCLRRGILHNPGFPTLPSFSIFSCELRNVGDCRVWHDDTVDTSFLASSWACSWRRTQTSGPRQNRTRGVLLEMTATRNCHMAQHEQLADSTLLSGYVFCTACCVLFGKALALPVLQPYSRQFMGGRWQSWSNL